MLSAIEEPFELVEGSDVDLLLEPILQLVELLE